MIFHQLEGVLEKMGVAVEDPVGQAFDPERHEAVMHIDSEELGENIVSQVFQKGFLLRREPPQSPFPLPGAPLFLSYSRFIVLLRG